MKKFQALLLALLLLFSVSVTAAADTFTDGFDPDTVVNAVLSNVNVVLNGDVTIEPGKNAGQYDVLYQGNAMGCMLFIGHQNAERRTSSEGVVNHIAVSVVFSDSTATDAYIYFWAAVAGAVMQYISGAEEMGTFPNDLYSVVMQVAQSTGNHAEYTLNGYDISVIAANDNGQIVVGMTVDIPGLY